MSLFNLEFYRPSEPPSVEMGEEYLIVNSCDGYHVAFANWDDEDFIGFSNWMRSHYFEPGEYVAWAPLPDTRLVINELSRAKAGN